MNVDSITANRYTYGNYELANKKNLPVSEQNSNIKNDFLKRGEELANKYFNISYANKPLPSESQIKELKDKYGDVEFTKEQYQSFLQDLTSMGVISDIESQLAGNESAMRLCIPVATAMVSPTWLYYSGVDLFQLDENTDVTEWIKYRAACDTSYFIDGVAHESSVDELYGYISNIISKIN